MSRLILKSPNYFSDEPLVVYVSKKHGSMYERYGDGKGANLTHTVQVDLKKYEKTDENILYNIYSLKEK